MTEEEVIVTEIAEEAVSEVADEVAIEVQPDAE
jgi:hypothetical protein